MKLITFLAFTCAGLVSCETAEFIQHTPTLVNTGQHTGKNQFTGRALYSTGSSSSNNITNSQGKSPYQSVNGFQAQASYSAGDKFALQAATMSSSEKGGSKESGNKTIVYTYKRNVTETGLAFFSPIGKQHVFFELGSGLGFGSYKARETTSPQVPGGRYYNHNVFKFYLQPVVYLDAPHVQVSGGIKLSFLRFGDISTDYTSAERDSRQLTKDAVLSTSTLDYFLRGEFFPGKDQSIGISFQSLLSLENGNKFVSNFNDNNLGIGLCFRLGGRKPKSSSAD